MVTIVQSVGGIRCGYTASHFVSDCLARGRYTVELGNLNLYHLCTTCGLRRHLWYPGYKVPSSCLRVIHERAGVGRGGRYFRKGRKAS